VRGPGAGPGRARRAFWLALVSSAMSTLNSMTATTNRNAHSSVAVTTGKCVFRYVSVLYSPAAATLNTVKMLRTSVWYSYMQENYLNYLRMSRMRRSCAALRACSAQRRRPGAHLVLVLVLCVGAGAVPPSARCAGNVWAQRAQSTARPHLLVEDVERKGKALRAAGCSGVRAERARALSMHDGCRHMELGLVVASVTWGPFSTLT